MGTMIELTIGDIPLDYAKNTPGEDYGYLFQEMDITKRHYKYIDYDKEETMTSEEKAELEISKLAFVSTVHKALYRLEMLGHSISTAKIEYENLCMEYCDSDYILEEPLVHNNFISFEEFSTLANQCLSICLNEASANITNPQRDTDYLEYYNWDREKISRIPSSGFQGSYHSASDFFESLFCILSPESMITIFGQDSNNKNSEIIWQFGPIVYSGWAARTDFNAGCPRNLQTLIVTEGASDTAILKRTLSMLYPVIADFFRFIEGDERHQFWGTGGLLKLAEGLVRIDIQNKIIFLLDNDAEGVATYKKLGKINMPTNMAGMLLPDNEYFDRFPTIGPDGASHANINGKAVAIECYLDLNLKNYPSPKVVWTNYKKELKIWHGALEHKESYYKNFLKQKELRSDSSNYDITRLISLIECLKATARKLI